MTGGEIVAVRVQESIIPPKRRSPEDLPVEEYTPKPYSLGPHEEPGYEPNPHAGLHNQEELTPDRKTSAESFKPTRQVDMRNLSSEDETAEKTLDNQGWDRDKVRQVIESGDNFTETSYQAGDKI